jgi:multidrug efflux system outer membrane protein
MRPSLRCFLGVAALILLGAGCVVGPEPARPPVTAPAAWRWQETNAPITVRPAERWWEVFGDRTLDELQLRALGANQDLRKAIARVEEGRAGSRSAKAGRYPSVNVTDSFERQRLSANGQQQAQFGSVGGVQPPLNFDRFRTALEGTYELDLWGKVKRSVQSATATEMSYAAARDAVRLNLTGDLAENYFSLRALDGESDILRRTADLRRQALALTEQRLREGLGLPSDVSRAETELANAESDLSDVQRRRALLEHALAVLCGEAPAGFRVEPVTSALNEPPAVPAGLPSELLLRRPDVAEAERLAAAQCAEIGVAKAAFLPAIKLTGTAGLESVELSDLFQWSSRSWSFGPSVTLPIFAAGKNRANLRAAEARYEQSVAQYRSRVLNAFREVEDALANSRLYAEQLAAQTRSLEASRRTAEHFALRLGGGMIGYLEVVDAERSRLQAERAVAQNLGNRYGATVKLLKALGGGWNGSQLTRR